jgi:hypothetical protein
VAVLSTRLQREEPNVTTMRVGVVLLVLLGNTWGLGSQDTGSRVQLRWQNRSRHWLARGALSNTGTRIRHQGDEYPYGDPPLGYFLYDATGHVSIHIMRNPPLPRLGEDGWRKASVEELREMLDAYVAYFGTYSVDSARGVVTHHVEGELRRRYTGTDQERAFTLKGDRLVIGDG